MGKENQYLVILAGGGGTRLWPKSRVKQPKQFLKLIGDKTLFQETVDRVKEAYPASQIYVVTNEDAAVSIRDQVPAIPQENIIVEPSPKSTTAAVGLAASYINRKNPQAIISTLAADHYIADKEEFMEVLAVSQEAAGRGDFLVTIGIRPSHPHTGMGYIQTGEKIFAISGTKVFKVRQFKEKPNAETAKEYFDSGEYFWNANINSYKTEAILNAIDKYLPSLATSLEKLPLAKNQQEAKEIWNSFPSEPIDTAILEKADNVLMVPGEFSWFDVGDWSAIHSIIAGSPELNVVIGEGTDQHLGIDTEGCLVHGSGRLIATVGIKDLVIIDTPDVVLICPKSRAQEVKKIVEKLTEQKREGYL